MALNDKCEEFSSWISRQSLCFKDDGGFPCWGYDSSVPMIIIYNTTYSPLISRFERCAYEQYGKA